MANVSFKSFSIREGPPYTICPYLSQHLSHECRETARIRQLLGKEIDKGCSVKDRGESLLSLLEISSFWGVFLKSNRATPLFLSLCVRFSLFWCSLICIKLNSYLHKEEPKKGSRSRTTWFATSRPPFERPIRATRPAGNHAQLRCHQRKHPPSIEKWYPGIPSPKLLDIVWVIDAARWSG